VSTSWKALAGVAFVGRESHEPAIAVPSKTKLIKAVSCRREQE